MAKKAPSDQLGLFDFNDLPAESPAAQSVIDKHIEKWEAQRTVEIKFSASEKRMWDEFCLLIGWALSAATWEGSKMAREISPGLVENHRGDIVLERFVTLFKYLEEEKEMMKQAKSEAEKEEVYNTIIKRYQDLRQRITDREVCFICCAASLAAPLSHDMTCEYIRAFATSYGIDKYIQLMGQFIPLDYKACQNFRRTHSNVAKTFPVLDEEWIKDFNRQGAMQALLTAPVIEEEPEYAQIVF